MQFTYCPAPDTLPPFELTEDQYRRLRGEGPADRELLLQLMVDKHAFSHRKVIGLYGSVAPSGLRHYSDEFHAALPAFMALGHAALDRATAAFDGKAAA